MNYKRMEWTCT